MALLTKCYAYAKIALTRLYMSNNMSNNESMPQDPVESMLLAGGPDMAAKADADKAIYIRLQEQAEYVGHLQRCASILDMPQQFTATGFAVPLNTPTN